eukprot:5330830-Amphidinium_carterae.1
MPKKRGVGRCCETGSGKRLLGTNGIQKSASHQTLLHKSKLRILLRQLQYNNKRASSAIP